MQYCLKGVTSGKNHLRNLASGQHSSKNVAAVETLCKDLIGLKIKPQTFCIYSYAKIKVLKQRFP